MFKPFLRHPSSREERSVPLFLSGKMRILLWRDCGFAIFGGPRLLEGYFSEVETVGTQYEREWKRKDRELYKKWGNVLKKLSEDPMYPSLRSHEIEDLSRRYGMKVWQSYLENNKSGARRMYWVYEADRQEITIIGLEPHPENTKNGAYDRIKLSGL